MPLLQVLEQVLEQVLVLGLVLALGQVLALVLLLPWVPAAFLESHFQSQSIRGRPTTQQA